MDRVVIIGDIHGCIEELDALLAQVRPGPRDRIVSVGDLVGKGPYPVGVIHRAREIGMEAVRGNHDQRCILWHEAVRAGREPPALKEHHRIACDALSEEDWAWLEALPYWLRLAEMNAIVVHAGIRPGVALEDQERTDLLHMRSIRPDGTASDRIEDGVPWASRWPGPEEVVFGHDAIRGLQRWPYATGLDTGCVYGGRLTAYILPEARLVHEPARRAWARKEGGP